MGADEGGEKLHSEGNGEENVTYLEASGHGESSWSKKVKILHPAISFVPLPC